MNPSRSTASLAPTTSSDRAHRRFKDAIYEQFARVGKAVSSPKRLELLDLLCQGERNVETLAREARMSVANTSQHLQVLRGARLIEAQKDGLVVTYRLADDGVGEFFLAMRRLAEDRLAEVERIARNYLDGRSGMEALDKQALLERVREGSVTVLDVRPVEEYRAGHLAGALSIPVRELERRLSELPRDPEIVAYCRGPYCVFAVRAVELLRAKGFRASRLDNGVQELRKAGFRIESGGDTGIRENRTGGRKTRTGSRNTRS